MNYCNAIILYDITGDLSQRLHAVSTACGCQDAHERITPVLTKLRWLPFDAMSIYPIANPIGDCVGPDSVGVRPSFA